MIEIIEMSKLKLSDLILGILILLLIIPKTRAFIHVNVHSLLSKINKVSLINIDNQKVVEYKGELKAINDVPNIELTSLKGKVVLVNFWATWCPPCIAEMESLQDLYVNYKDEVKFLFITSDSPELTNTFLQKNNYSLPCYNIISPLSTAFEHSSIPTTYIVNKQGNVVVKKTGAIDWNSKKIHSIIDELLKE